MLIGPEEIGVRLALAECFQALGDFAQAKEQLQALLEKDPTHPIVRLSMAELLLDDPQVDPQGLQTVVHLAENVENRDTVETALLYYKGVALFRLGLLTAARQALTLALRRKKGRPQALLQAILYQRAQVNGAAGRKAQARADLERLYAADPEYEDVAERLHLGS